MNLLKLGAGIMVSGCSVIVLLFLLVILAGIWGVSC
jgi:Na+-transporting methylmalonyl-CoA/oxaloacetate decarboxylase gamma subunit